MCQKKFCDFVVIIIVANMNCFRRVNFAVQLI